MLSLLFDQLDVNCVLDDFLALKQLSMSMMHRGSNCFGIVISKQCTAGQDGVFVSSE
jgi:hypothetical protein